MTDELDDFDTTLNREGERRREFLLEHYGERCRDYDSLCICCRVWENQDDWETLTAADY